MNLNLELLDPVFKTLDALIEDYSVYLYLALVWLALAVIAWIISGGLRRRMKGNPVTIIPAFIIMAQPPRQPEPPIVDIEVEQTWNDDDESTD